MIIVLQRVSAASVSIDNKMISSIKKGYLLLVGIEYDDTIADIETTAKKITDLRIFPNDAGKFDLSLNDVNGEILAVSQFTLLGDTSKGRRPSFHKAASPLIAKPLFEKFVEKLKSYNLIVSTGVFGANMQVSLTNDGPVTVIINSKISRRGNKKNQQNQQKSNKNTHQIKDIPPLEDFKNLLQGYPEVLFDLAYPKAPDFNTLPDEYKILIKENLPLLNNKITQFKDKLDQILLLPDPSAALQWFYDSGILDLFIPELSATVNLSNPDDKRHKHVWEHTKQVVYQAKNTRLLRYTALFHDIGKVKTRKFTDDGKVTFYAHDLVGAKMFGKIAERLGLEKNFYTKIKKLIKWHLRPGQYLSSWTDSAVRRFYTEIDEDLLWDLLDLGRADITSKRQGRRDEAIGFINELAKRIVELQKAEELQKSVIPKGLGNLIIQQFNLKPGPKIGAIRNLLDTKVHSGELQANQPPEYYIKYLISISSELQNILK